MWVQASGLVVHIEKQGGERLRHDLMYSTHARTKARQKCIPPLIEGPALVAGPGCRFYWWIWMLPLRSFLPAPSVGPALTVMLKESLVPGSPLSVTLTVKVHGARLLVQVPQKVAVLPVMANMSNRLPCTFSPFAWLTYWRSP